MLQKNTPPLLSGQQPCKSWRPRQQLSPPVQDHWTIKTGHMLISSLYTMVKNRLWIHPSIFDGFCAALFRTHFEDAKVLEEESSDATIDLVEHFSSYWQTKDMPVEHVLTTWALVQADLVLMILIFRSATTSHFVLATSPNMHLELISWPEAL